METVEGQVRTGATISLDDKHFIHCHFRGCRLIYGGGQCQFTETRFEECEIAFTGAAERTISLLGTFGALVPAPPPAPMTIQ